MEPYPPPETTLVGLSTFAAGTPDAWVGVLLVILLALALMFVALWALRGNPIVNASVSFPPPRSGVIAAFQFIPAIPWIALSALMLYVNVDALKSLVHLAGRISKEK